MIAFIRAAIRFSTVFLFGSTGETINEKSGHLNLGIPGVMCIGAFGGCAGLVLYLKLFQNLNEIICYLGVVVGILSCLICGAICGALFSFFSVTLKCNQNVIGLTLTTFGIGLNSLGFKALYADESVISFVAQVSRKFSRLFPFGASENWAIQLFGSYGILVYLAIIISIITAIFLRKTRIGLNLKAVGESLATADAAGINVSLYRYLATIIGCGIASLGGLFYIMDYLGGNVEYAIDSFGWLAVAIVIFSMWKPDVGILASFVFGALYIAPSYLNLDSVGKNLFSLIPYAVTIVVLILTTIFNKKNSQPPENLGLSYDREKR